MRRRARRPRERSTRRRELATERRANRRAARRLPPSPRVVALVVVRGRGRVSGWVPGRGEGANTRGRSRASRGPSRAGARSGLRGFRPEELLGVVEVLPLARLAKALGVLVASVEELGVNRVALRARTAAAALGGSGTGTRVSHRAARLRGERASAAQLAHQPTTLALLVVLRLPLGPRVLFVVAALHFGLRAGGGEDAGEGPAGWTGAASGTRADVKFPNRAWDGGARGDEGREAWRREANATHQHQLYVPIHDFLRQRKILVEVLPWRGGRGGDERGLSVGGRRACVRTVGKTRPVRRASREPRGRSRDAHDRGRRRYP